MFIKFFVFFGLCFFASLNEVDCFLRDSLDSSFVLEARQIKIPGYPNAYNPSLIPHKGGYLLSFRFISRYPENFENQGRKDVSLIGLVRLDKNFKVLEKTVQLLSVSSYSSKFSLSAEDARLLKVGDRIFLFFNDLPLLQTPGRFAMYFGELSEEKGLFALKGPAKLLNYAHAVEIEKNWSPFFWGEEVYVIYADQPRIILKVDLETGDCQEIARTKLDWAWNLGEIRGGTPASLIDGEFLTFFHSCFPAKTPKGRAYVMGAYTFDAAPPFSVRKVVSHPLGTLSDYTEGNSPKVVFPGGIVVQDGLVHVAWGKSDKQIWITTFDKTKLLGSMGPSPK